MKKISVNQIPGIEEVNMIKDDGTVMHFNNPKVINILAVVKWTIHRPAVESYLICWMLIKIHFHQVQASLASNTFAIAGHAENKQITELLPGILNQVSDL